MGFVVVVVFQIISFKMQPQLVVVMVNITILMVPRYASVFGVQALNSWN